MNEGSMDTSTWHRCYTTGLHDIIVPEAFSHPAKMSWALAQRIMQHLGEDWPSLSAVVDPMAGVGTVGLAVTYSGYAAILGELEGHFAGLCAENIAKHAERLRALGKPIPLLFRHDARHTPLNSADAIVTSPPFQDVPFSDPTFVQNDGRKDAVRFATYGSHPGQIGNLRAIVTSPPFSPPGAQTTGRGQYVRNSLEYTESGRHKNASPDGDYGKHLGQIGNDAGTDYWSAMAKVYLECARILSPGAPMILVVKGYIRKGEYVDLPMQTAQLIDSCGFDIVHWHNASLVDRESQLGLFGGETRTSRKSFFRRLAEKSGAPPIDVEVVLCAERRSLEDTIKDDEGLPNAH